jgi:hypothetical protein
VISALLLAALLFGAPPAAAPTTESRVENRPGKATVLRTLEGKVAEVGETAGEGELPVVTLTLQTREGDFRVLVAPAEVLADIGFAVGVGDQVRARVFLAPVAHTAYAQKLLNESRDLMVRLRTLRHEPLWDAAGKWQGSPAELPGRGAADRPARRGGDRTTPERNPPPPPR